MLDLWVPFGGLVHSHMVGAIVVVIGLHWDLASRFLCEQVFIAIVRGRIQAFLRTCKSIFVPDARLLQSGHMLSRIIDVLDVLNSLFTGEDIFEVLPVLLA